MTTWTRRRAVTAASALTLGGCATLPPSEGRLITCGGPEVNVRALDGSVLWTWSVERDPSVPDRMRSTFVTTADCKPIDGGRSILIVSSYDGVAVVDRRSARANFLAIVGHAHSADVTPGGLMLVAGSDGDRGGDVLALYDRRDGSRRLGQTPFDSAHGVVFDAAAGGFWALGRSELRLLSADASLSTMASYTLPTLGGHDLSRDRAGRLTVSTDADVYSFDIGSGHFHPHPQLSGLDRIKSVDRSADGRIVYVKADVGVWWSRFATRLPGAARMTSATPLYKVRWA